MANYKDVFEFQDAHPNKDEREKALRLMSNEQIDKLISTCGTPQAKTYYASFVERCTKNGTSYLIKRRNNYGTS